MPSVRRSLVAAVATAALLAGCGTTSDPSSDPASDPSPTETTVQPTTPPGSTPDSTPDSTPGSGPAAEAVADLAGSLGVDMAAVEVVSIEEVTWRDGSRGCARPGVMYTQALIDGSRIILRVDRTTYEYHSGGSGPPSLCEQPTQ